MKQRLIKLRDWIEGYGMYEERIKSETIVCKFCGSPEIVKNGKRKDTQYWICKNCGRGFVDNGAIPKMKFPIEDIASAVYQYFAGYSLNDIRGHIEQQSHIRPSDSTVYEWVKRFSKVAGDKEQGSLERCGDVWQADETVLHNNWGGKKKKKLWLIDIIDRDTRFLLASKVSLNHDRKDTALAFKEAKKRAGKSPKKILTDGWNVYPDAIDLVFGHDTIHEPSNPFRSKRLSTNIIERVQGTLKDRTKVMRGVKSIVTAESIIDGWLIYYNYFRPHETLGNKTPAEVAGAKYPYRNWLDVVKSQTPLGQVKQSLKISQQVDIASPLPHKPYRKRSKPISRKIKRNVGTTLGMMR